MASRKKVLTTGEVAKLCNVAPRTVSKWFDTGQLRGYRIPGSKDRRIPVDELIRFMRAHGMPLEGLETEERRVLVLDADVVYCDALRSALVREGLFSVSTASSSFEAGAMTHAQRPHAIVVDVSLPDVLPRGISRFIRSHADYKDVRLIGVARDMSDAKGHALLQEGFDAYLGKPFEARALARLIETGEGTTSLTD